MWLDSDFELDFCGFIVLELEATAGPTFEADLLVVLFGPALDLSLMAIV